MGLYLPFAITLVAAVGWSGFWIYARAQAAERIEAGAEQLRKAGYDVSWAERRITGYPFRLNVTLTDARLREPSGWGLAAPRLETQAYMHGLGTWVIATPTGLTFTRPTGGAVSVKGDVIHASLSHLDSPLPNFSFEGTKLTFAPAAGAQPFALSAADKVEFHLRPGPDDQAAVMFKVDAGKAQLSGLFARLAGDKPISILWDSTLSKVSAFKGGDWPDAVRSWVAAGGLMTVRQAGVTAGEAVIGAKSGTLGVGYDGRLTGHLDVTLREAPKALSAMAETGVIRPEAALAASAVAAARQGTGDVAQANVTFQAGQTTLGPVAVGPAPKVY
ncbi:DUF2125 domain-containing protein [Phenylobacterium sp. Root700]|uniref:DUF2125 domain-containing protein n=1 Tax=Phenylobacterium sp. Root700 TaxID=1736591 RepID=UPI0006FC4DA9|nr:DUF2125 domain-containing protein [Phenylobacterium sp. Root700]KRB42785.1 hypothetical protein ASE02_20900 [Phenylobacterium sp. Root700]